MLLALVIGVALFAAWAVLWLLESRWRALPVYHRPRITHSPAYSLWAGPARKAVLGASLVALLAAHWAAAAAAAAILLGGWGLRRFLTGPGGRSRQLRREFERLRREQPEVAEVEILYQVIYERHRRWGPELVKQIVEENPTLEEAARMVWRLERELLG